MKNTVIELIKEEKIIVIVRNVAREKLISLAQAMYNGGIRLLEITYSANEDISDAETALNIEMLSKHFNGRMCIGAGTVLNETQVELTKKSGGQFIISPNTCENVIKKTCDLHMVSIPGALTPSEIQAAHKYGADFVKLFPITNMGKEYVKAVKMPLSHINLLAVGGIDIHNLEDYLNVGIAGFGIGSNIVDKKLIDNNKFKEITELAQSYTRLIRK